MNGWDALFWLFAVEALFIGLALIGMPLLIAALLLRKSPRPRVRWLARVLMGVDAVVLAALLVAMVQVSIGFWQADQKRRSYEARALQLTLPQVVAGIAKGCPTVVK